MIIHQKIMITLSLSLVIVLSCGEKKIEEAKKETPSSSEVKQDSELPVVEKPKDLQPVTSATMMKFVFKKGDVFGYKIQTITHVVEQTDSTKQVNHQDIRYSYKFEVLDSDGSGTGRLKATCTEVVFNGKFGAKEMSYNSSSVLDKAQEKMYSQYNAPLNVPVEIRVNSEGTVVSISSEEKIAERLMGGDFKTSKAKARKQVATDYANTSIKSIIQLAFQKLSDEPVANDSAWVIIWEGTIGFLQVKNIATYTLLGVKTDAIGKYAHISMSMRSNYIGPKKVETGQGEATIETFDVKGTGTALFDLEKNRPRKRVMEQKLLTKIVVDPPEDLKQQMPNLGLIHISQHATVNTMVEAF